MFPEWSAKRWLLTAKHKTVDWEECSYYWNKKEEIQSKKWNFMECNSDGNHMVLKDFGYAQYTTLDS